MLTVRRTNDRGYHRESWLESRHTFSFHTYYDPDQMGFRALRVINQDRVKPGHGFDMHPHRDMEIFTLVLSGALEHVDDLGNRQVIGPYQMQKITAGTGIRHSEHNPSDREEVHFLQVWIEPEAKGLAPDYLIKDFSKAVENSLTPILTPDGREDSGLLRQDASVYLGRLRAESALNTGLDAGRHAWVQLISGDLDVNGVALEDGDGLAVSDVEVLRLMTVQGSDFLLFDLG